MRLIYLILPGILLHSCQAGEEGNETESDTSRKILGSSVVTSVSVIMDTGNKKNTIFTDAVGKPQTKPSNPSELASPIDLLNPDRYEFYTFDDNGDLVKRLMSLDEIKSIIATGDNEDFDLDTFTSQGFLPEKRVSDVVSNVQNVLKEEMEILKDPINKPIFDTPDVSDSWSMILPAVFGNSGEDFKPEKPMGAITPDTFIVEPTTKKPPVISSSTFVTPLYYSSTPPALAHKISSAKPSLDVEIISNSGSTEKQTTSTEIPTRPPVVYSTAPPLIRNTSITSQPTTTLQWQTSSLKTTIPQLISTTFKATARPNIFGLPAYMDPDHLSDYRTTTSLPGPNKRPGSNIFGIPVTDKSESASSKIDETKPSKRPVSNIFGFPMSTEKFSTLITSKRPVPTEYITKKSVPTTTEQITSTQSSKRPGSSTEHVTSTTKAYKRPVSNIFGLTKSPEAPTFMQLITFRPSKRPTASTVQTSTSTEQTSTSTAPFSSPVSPTSSTLSASAVSKISIDPQLSTSGIVYSEATTSKPSTWVPAAEDAQLFSIFKDVLSQGVTTEKIRRTTYPTAVTDNVDTTSIGAVLNFESNKIQTTDSFNDLNTLQTENVPTSTFSDKDEKVTTLPPILSSLNDNQKLSASELLDQLLLTTNIYEINTELATSKLNISDLDNRFDNSNSTVSEDLVQQTTSTDGDRISYPPTTDITLIQSIEQLLSQAVGDVQAIVNLTTESTKHLYQTNEHALSKESEPLESDITTSNTDIDLISTTLKDETTALNMAASVEAVMSQVANNTSMVVTERENDEKTVTSTETVPTTIMTEAIPTSIATESATIYYVIRKEPTTVAPTTNLINITLISSVNRTKPAKADLSLEQEVLAEELKNFTLMQDQNTTPTEPIAELLKESETMAFILNSTTENEVAATTTTDVSTTIDIETTIKPLEETTTAEIFTTDTHENLIIQPSTTKAETIKSGPRPSIVIGVNSNGTVVTENGKLVANKTLSTTHPEITTLRNNSTQDQTWTLVSTMAPQQASEQNLPPPTISYPPALEKPAPVDLVPKPMQGFGLEDTTSTLDVDVHQFIQLCNELAFGFWKTVTTGLSSARSIFVSPFAATSMLAMVFLGAKGGTSEEMNEILKLDDMVTFNPHLTFKSVSESIVAEPKSGIATTAMIRELFSDRSKGKLLDFYKSRVKAFYDGYVEEVSYREIGDVIRRRSNLLVKKYSDGKYPQFIKDASIVARAPLSGLGINIFETDCSDTSKEGRDGEMHFIVHPSIKQRRLVPIPAVVYKTGFLAGYEPSLDATAVAIGHKGQTVSTIFVAPGQQGISASGDGLIRLEKRLVESSFKKGAWSRLLRSLIPRPGLEVQIPRFSHRSVINATTTLQRMGLHELFNPASADLRGLNGVANELHLADVLQINKFATCGDVKGDDAHHSEVYPATTMRARSSRRLRFSSLDQDEPRDYQRAFHDPLHDPTLLDLPLSLRPRQARIPDVPRLRFDRPFLYFVRHNPTGLILHMGRFNPRLLP